MTGFDDIEPPGGLKKDVVRELRQRGVVRPPLSVRLARISAGVAGAAVLVMAGALLRPAFTESPPTGTTESPRFLMLLYEDDSFREDPGQVAEYGAWAASLRAEGRDVYGEKLAPESVTIGGVVRGAGATGLFVISAASLEEAQMLARESPHVQYGGQVVVRPIETF